MNDHNEEAAGFSHAPPTPRKPSAGRAFAGGDRSHTRAGDGDRQVTDVLLALNGALLVARSRPAGAGNGSPKSPASVPLSVGSQPSPHGNVRFSRTFSEHARETAAFFSIFSSRAQRDFE
jgi:hypothetical protein